MISANNNNESVISSLSQLSVSSVAHSPVKSEMMLLSSLMTKQEDACWEMRLRLVVHILLRSLDVASIANATSSWKGQHQRRLVNPVVIEALTLPCLRILNHVCKTTTNMTLISQLAASGGGLQKSKPPTLPVRQSLFMSANAGGNLGAADLSRFNSEPVETNYIQLQNLAQINSLNSNYLAHIPRADELDPVEFLQS